MKAFLQGHVALVVGTIGFALALVTRRGARDEQLKRDVGGAAPWLLAFLFLRLNAFWLEDQLSREWNTWLRVLWMLAFSYGTVRLGVSYALALRRRFAKSPTAKIHRDVADFVLYVLVTIPVLKAELKLDVTTLIGTSAVLSLVLGLALQDTLGNLFAGLSLQLERPYGVGDFIRVGEHEGRVAQMSWRSTRIETFRKEAVTLPNNVIAKEHLINFSRGGQPVAIDLSIGTAYAAAPNFVKQEVLETLREAPLVLNDPPPLVAVSAFGDSAVTYLVRFYVKDYASVPRARDQVLSQLWSRFGRDGIEIPFPQRVVHLRQPAPAQRETPEALLGGLELFRPFLPRRAPVHRPRRPGTALRRRRGDRHRRPRGLHLLRGRLGGAVGADRKRAEGSGHAAPRRGLRRDVAAHRRAPRRHRGGDRRLGRAGAGPGRLREALRRAPRARAAAGRRAGHAPGRPHPRQHRRPGVHRAGGRGEPGRAAVADLPVAQLKAGPATHASRRPTRHTPRRGQRWQFSFTGRAGHAPDMP